MLLAIQLSMVAINLFNWIVTRNSLAAFACGFCGALAFVITLDKLGK